MFGNILEYHENWGYDVIKVDGTMRYQQKPYYCGPASVQNALLRYGKLVGQDRIARMASTTKEDGTDEHGLKKAIESLGYQWYELHNDDWLTALTWMGDQITAGRPIILCVERWLHWVTMIGGIGFRPRFSYITVDPARFPHNSKENGVHVWGYRKLKKEWTAARKVHEGTGRYYALSVGRV
jgi:hypothetical protein